MVITDIELGWIAGLFEGEGSIYSTPIRSGSRTGRIHLRLELHMTDEDVVRRFAAIVGVGTVRGPYRSGGDDRFRPRWKWRISGAPAVEFLTQSGILDLLGERRRAKAEGILAVLEEQGPVPVGYQRCKPGCDCGRHRHRRCAPGCQCRRHVWRKERARAA